MERFMLEALKQAKKAQQNDEVPIGAVIVKDGKIIAKAYNRRNTDKLACAHAEVLAINKACKTLGDWRLNGCSLYVTLEPCPMCAGACFNARLDEVVYGATDEKSGAFSACGLNMQQQLLLNHKLRVQSGVMQKQCKQIIEDFFKSKR